VQTAGVSEHDKRGAYVQTATSTSPAECFLLQREVPEQSDMVHLVESVEGDGSTVKSLREALVLGFRFPSGSTSKTFSPKRPEVPILSEILFRNGNLTSALAGWWRRLWAGSGCGGSGRAPGWCGWAVASLLRRCCGGAVCWRPAISLLAQSVVVGEVG
jgi:hypothetical protein